MNTTLLRKTVDWIREEPRRLNMDEWFKWFEFPEEDPKKPPCGSQACVAGTVCIISGTATKSLDYAGFYKPPSGGWAASARQLLGLSYAQANRLFRADREAATVTPKELSNAQEVAYEKFMWPKRYLASYRRALTPAGRFRVLSQRVEHFIKTRGAE